MSAMLVVNCGLTQKNMLYFYCGRQPAWASNIVWSVPRDWLKVKNTETICPVKLEGFECRQPVRETEFVSKRREVFRFLLEADETRHLHNKFLRAGLTDGVRKLSQQFYCKSCTCELMLNEICTDEDGWVYESKALLNQSGIFRDQ